MRTTDEPQPGWVVAIDRNGNDASERVRILYYIDSVLDGDHLDVRLYSLHVVTLKLIRPSRRLLYLNEKGIGVGSANIESAGIGSTGYRGQVVTINRDPDEHYDILSLSGNHMHSVER